MHLCLAKAGELQENLSKSGESVKECYGNQMLLIAFVCIEMALHLNT